MTQSEKDAIVKKCVELKFERVSDEWFRYELPFGNNTALFLGLENLNATIDTKDYFNDCAIETPIRKIDSPEDLETLFNAICPEKYRLPFDNNAKILEKAKEQIKNIFEQSPENPFIFHSTESKL